MNSEEYFAIPAMNASTIKQGLKSMLNMKHYLDHGLKSTPAMRLGSLIHAAVLEPDTFHACYPLWATPRRGPEWKAFVEDVTANGLDPADILTTAEYDAVCGARDAVFLSKPAKDLLRGTVSEMSLQWEDELAGPSKCRIDYADGLRWGDVKTSRAVDPWAFNSQAYKLGYDVQLAWYRRGVRSKRDGSGGMVSVITVTTKPPFDCVVYRVPDQYMDHGEKRLEDVLKRWKVAEHLKRYPGVCPEVTDLELPGWVTGGEPVKLIDDDGSEVEL